MNYYTIYEKLLISLYFLYHLFFLQKKAIFLFSASFWAFSFVFSREKCKFAEKIR